MDPGLLTKDEAEVYRLGDAPPLTGRDGQSDQGRRPDLEPQGLCPNCPVLSHYKELCQGGTMHNFIFNWAVLKLNRETRPDLPCSFAVD